ncbi:MAG: DUF6491 family protein [Proteobacteria bacterium]|nr:DUF6491 family protein [Pseudomonadota bacterium]
MQIILFTLIITSLLSCSSTGEPTRFKIYDDYIIENNLEETTRVTNFNFRGWTSLDDKHLIVSSTHSKTYLITLTTYCADLSFSNAIVLDQTNNTSLNSKFDSISIPKHKFSQKCRISTIHPISSEQQKQIIKLRKRAK